MIDALGTLAAHLQIGIDTALSPVNLLYCFIGVFLGTLVGVLPGIGAMAAMSMLFPLTFYLDATTALIMLGGIYYGTGYGGSTAAILLNVPGTPSSVVASLEGYPMAKQGRAGVALFLCAIGSFCGGSIATVLIMLFAPVIGHYARNFGSPEYFSLIVLGLIAASTILAQSPMKGLAMVVFGILLGTVGMDIYTGHERFTFGMLNLMDGVGLIPIAMGLFGVAEVIVSVRSVVVGSVDAKAISMRSMIPTRDDLRRFRGAMLRGTGVGSAFGILPGAGSTIASFMAYALEMKVSRRPEKFGHGAVEGLVSPETANNAAEMTAFVPTLTLGIPGSAVMAIMIGALMIQGVTPGPLLMTEKPDLFWGLIMSFWIGNFLLILLNIPLIGLWVRLLAVPYKVLYPAILALVCIGVYSVHNSSFDVWMVLVFGGLGYLMRLADLPAPALLLGFVLGPMMEEHFRRAMIISRGDFWTFFDRPISGAVMATAILLIGWSVWSAFRAKTRQVREA